MERHGELHLSNHGAAGTEGTIVDSAQLEVSGFISLDYCAAGTEGIIVDCTVRLINKQQACQQQIKISSE